MKTTIDTQAMEKARVQRERSAHWNALRSIARRPKDPLEGVTLWRRLRKVELEASRAATAQCNAAPFEGQPYREEAEWDAFCNRIAAKVAKILGHVPDGFTINGDPRGYALKIDPDKGTVPPGMVTDWGRYGLLAPVID